MVAWLGGPVVVITALWGGMDYFGATPVFHKEMDPITVQVTENTEKLIEIEMRDLRIQQKQNMRDQREFVKGDLPVPDWLLEEETDLQIKLERLERQLKELSK